MASVLIDNTKVKNNHFLIASLVADGRFEILKHLGSGSFGEVFLAKDLTNQCLCALKTERTDAKHPQLKIEKRVFTTMKNCKTILLSVVFHRTNSFLGQGFPSMIHLAEEKDFYILAMDLLGPSLEDLLHFCQRRFSKKTVLMLIDQAIRRVELLHEHSLIHRDVDKIE